MVIQKPYGGSSIERLTAMINLDNQSKLRVGVDFTFGVPSVEVGDDERNTKIDLIPTKSNPWKTQTTIYYRRLSLAILRNLPVGMVVPVQLSQAPFRIHDVLDRINEGLGLNLTKDEVENTSCTDKLSQYSLVVKEGSLGWLPSSFTFDAEFPVDRPLDEVITVTVLSGLAYRQ